MNLFQLLGLWWRMFLPESSSDDLGQTKRHPKTQENFIFVKQYNEVTKANCTQLFQSMTLQQASIQMIGDQDNAYNQGVLLYNTDIYVETNKHQNIMRPRLFLIGGT